MTDANRRKMILLAEARAGATSAVVVLQRLRATLEQLGELDCADRVTDLVNTVLTLRENSSRQISEVPS